ASQCRRNHSRDTPGASGRRPATAPRPALPQRRQFRTYAFSLTLLSGCAEPRGIAGDTLLAAAGNRQSVGLNVLRHHAAGGDHGAVTDLHRRHQGRIRADEGAGADIGVILAETVVVAGDRAGADIGFGTDAGIADIGQVIDLGAGLDARLLHLDEIADMRL